jgi:hypothetical protein
MAKGAYLTPRIRELITRIYLDDRQIRPTEAHKLLLQKMKAEGLHEIFGPSFPSISTVSKELKSLREKDEARSSTSKGLDEPWTIASVGPLSEYPIPAEAMPTVMAIYRKAPIVSRQLTPEGEVVYRMLEGGRQLTIRQAQWIARLYKVIDDPDLLWDWAWSYAMQEWVAEVTGKPFFFPELDVELMENPQSARDERRAFERWGAVWDIAEKYSADLDEAVDVMGHLTKLDWETLSNEEIEETAKSLKTNKEVKRAKKSHKP